MSDGLVDALREMIQRYRKLADELDDAAAFLKGGATIHVKRGNGPTEDVTQQRIDWDKAKAAELRQIADQAEASL